MPVTQVAVTQAALMAVVRHAEKPLPEQAAAVPVTQVAVPQVAQVVAVVRHAEKPLPARASRRFQ